MTDSSANVSVVVGTQERAYSESALHHECESSSVSSCPQNCPVPVDRICAKDFCFLFVGVCCSVALWGPRDCSTPGFPVLHHLLEFAQTHVHRVKDAVQPSLPLPPPSPPALSLSQHQSLFQGVGSSHQVAKVFVFKMQEKKILWIFYLNLSNGAYYGIPLAMDLSFILLTSPCLPSFHLLTLSSLKRLLIATKPGTTKKPHPCFQTTHKSSQTGLYPENFPRCRVYNSLRIFIWVTKPKVCIFYHSKRNLHPKYEIKGQFLLSLIISGNRIINITSRH